MIVKSKTIYNSIVGFGCQLIILALGFIVPRVVLTHYGSDVNGFTNTMSQIFSYLALLEAGITKSTSMELYKYLKDNNKNGISYTMSASRRYYRKITIIYFGFVLIVALFAPLVLKTKIPYSTVFLYIIFEGLTSVVTFYSISLIRTFLNANGRAYIVNYISLLQKILLYGVKIGLSLKGWNIAFIQVGYFIVSLIQLFIYTSYMKKHYNWIDYNAAPRAATLPDRYAFLITEIAYTIFNSTDLIVLSVFVSTALSSVYSTYNMVFVAIETLITSVYNSIKYNLGQTFHKDIKEYCKLHDLYNSVFIGICAALMCVTYFLLNSFVSLYTRDVTDINYLYHWLPLMFCIVRLLSRSRSISGNISGIAGYAKHVSKISLIEAVSNVVLSVILVQKYEIYGVLLATVISLPLKVVYVTWLVEKKVMGRNGWQSVKIIGVNFLLFFIAVILAENIKLKIYSYKDFFACGCVLTPVFVVLSYVFNGIANRNVFKLTNKMLKRIRC